MLGLKLNHVSKSGHWCCYCYRQKEIALNIRRTVKEDFQVLQGLLLTWINFNPDMDK